MSGPQVRHWIDGRQVNEEEWLRAYVERGGPQRLALALANAARARAARQNGPEK